MDPPSTNEALTTWITIGPDFTTWCWHSDHLMGFFPWFFPVLPSSPVLCPLFATAAFDFQEPQRLGNGWGPKVPSEPQPPWSMGPSEIFGTLRKMMHIYIHIDIDIIYMHYIIIIYILYQYIICFPNRCSTRPRVEDLPTFNPKIAQFCGDTHVKHLGLQVPWFWGQNLNEQRKKNEERSLQFMFFRDL